MKVPSQDQTNWARDSWVRVTENYREWTGEGFHDFAPMLALIEHIRRSGNAEALSAGTSLDHLVVASAAHVNAPNKLADDAPAICVSQLATEFEFRDATGRKRKCPFDRAAEVFDAHLVRLGLQTDAYDRRTVQ